MSTVKVGDINIEYYADGSGPPLLLVAGVGANANTWGEPFLDCIRSRFRIIWMSNRGMGGSDAGSDELTVRLMAQDAAGLLRELGIEATHVFGYSMGGYIAQELALNYPQLIKRLVLGCTNCGPSRSVPQSTDDVGRIGKIMSQSGDDRVRGFCTIMVSEEFAQTHDEFMTSMVEAHRSTSMETFSRQMAAINAFDSYDRLSFIKAMTLVIHGDQDIVITPGNADLLRERMANASVRVVSGTGHMFMWERRQRTSFSDSWARRHPH